jgi:hypothetical protein
LAGLTGCERYMLASSQQNHASQKAKTGPQGRILPSCILKLCTHEIAPKILPNAFAGRNVADFMPETGRSRRIF